MSTPNTLVRGAAHGDDPIDDFDFSRFDIRYARIGRARRGHSCCCCTDLQGGCERWTAADVPARARWKNIAVLGNKETMEAALAWYRARGAIRSPLGPIRVPTLYNWSYDDDAVGPRPRVPSFSSWPQSFRGAGRRRPFSRRPDPGREQADAGAHRGASGLAQTHAAFAISFTRSHALPCMPDH